MTLEQFLKRLSRYRGQFYVTSIGYLRRNKTGQCPIETVSSVSRGRYLRGSKKLGLSTKQKELILQASDDHHILSSSRSLRLRRKMVQVLGLK